MKSIRPSLIRPPRDGSHRRDIPLWYLKPVRTHDQVAKIMGLTKAQVSHAEELALKKLRLLLEADEENPQPPTTKDNTPPQETP